MEEKKRLKVFSSFAGYGTDHFALKSLQIPFDCVGFSEIDKYAIQCFKQNHGGENFGDIRKINPNNLPDFDLFTAGFPCQPFSIAGKKQGELDTRGTLFYDIIRICEEKKPKYLLLENVKGLASKTHKHTMEKILSELKRIGYFVKWSILNTRDYGIPQNRERLFFACFREEIDCASFSFPEKEDLNLFIKDLLEEIVGEKYFLKPHQVPDQERFDYGYNDTPKIFAVRYRSNGDWYENPHYPQIEFAPPDCSFALTTVPKDNYVFVVNTQTRSKNRPALINKTSSGGSGIIHKRDGVTYCLDTGNNQAILDKKHKIFRKLTPKECFRLQGFLNDEINLEGISDAQCYKLSGNGQSVNVIKKILGRMLWQEF